MKVYEEKIKALAVVEADLKRQRLRQEFVHAG